LTEFSLSLPPVPAAARLARAATRDNFGGLLRRDTMADLELVVSELVTNAVDHGRGSIELVVHHDGDELRGSVTDEGHGFAYRPHVVADDEHRGRGLSIVDTLVTRWGIADGSTHVWFHIVPPQR
jgi:anti-sigma regulatory factor (Ser/Thr protein kinase)